MGFTLTTDSEAPAGAGIGGSSAMAVAICAALDRLTTAGLRREDWIHISRDVEAIVIRVPTGTQDHYPPAFGGAAAIVLSAGGERRETLGCDRAALEGNTWSEVGRLVREEWEFRRRNLRTISTPVIDRIISSARRQGALGGKVCGAGGGGCLTLVIEPDARARVEAAVTAAGGTLLPLRIDRDGVQVRSDVES
jgi:D-glycero-alpha-D-manno-heptose-7-phosphate kinase